ncbi:uncharacterized protein LOC110041110 [Orbicella faveolata]|uniref:uncharacterized protein LOC110041110 n=1 Tax=Orbicella faveolata TaxID=48498 RepID=UPI0009E5C48E|nr:uncharacterized protein LOC110041110 [Orbicella faveolata]
MLSMKMASVNFRPYVYLALLLSVFCHTETLKPSHHYNTTVDGLNDETRCSWNCTDIDSYLREEMKKIIAKNKIIRLAVKYEVMDKCVDQTSGNYIEHLQLWRANKQPSIFTKALESVVNLMSRTDSVEEHKEITAICTLTPVNTTATEPTDYNGSSPIFSRSHLADLGVKFNSIDCNTETTENSQPCINIIKSTGNNNSTFKGPLKRDGWPEKVLVLLNIGFLTVFSYFSPAFLCLFSPTEITEDNVHQIVLDGASPVSLRSLIGNYFFSKEDTIWHRVRMFFLRAVVLPLLYVGPAIFAKYRQQNMNPTFNVFGMSHFLHLFMIVSYVCYYITAYRTSFTSAGSSGGSDPCTVCKRIKSKTIICQGNLPKRIRNHLRIQPLILVKCSRLFIRLLLTYFKKCFLLIPYTFEFSSFFFLRLFLFIVLLSASPAITTILVIYILLLISLSLMRTIPVTILASNRKCGVNVYFRHNRCLLLLSNSVFFMIAMLASLGSMLFLTFAGFGVAIAISLAFVLLLSEEILPFVACFVLVLYYFWSSYSSFTNKYQDLGFAIFKHYKSYKKSQDIQVADMTSNTDSTQNAVGNQDNVMKIPKELFHMACEELMPIRESVCVLLLKIVAIYMDGRRQKNIEAMTADEKIPLIVQEYIEGISAVNQGQENSGVDVDEVMLQNVNEESFELAIT